MSNSNDIKSIRSMEALDESIKQMLDLFEQNAMDYELKESHEFTMILPENPVELPENEVISPDTSAI